MVNTERSKTRVMAETLSASDAFEAGVLTFIYTNQTAEVHELAYSRDGKRMVLGMDGEPGDDRRHVVIIDFPDENLYGVDAEGLNILKLMGHSSSIYSVRFSSSGYQVASSGRDNTIKIWDAINGGQPLSTFEDHEGDVYDLSYNPVRDDRLASSDRFGVIYIWDPTKKADENPILSLEGHSAEVRSIRYSPDGTHLVSGSYDYSVMIWDTNRRSPIVKFIGHLAGINSVSYRPDGKRVASCSNDGTVKIWDVSNLTSNSTITSQKTVNTIYVHAVLGDNECKQVEYSPDGKLIATEGNGNTIKIWNVEKDTSAQLMWMLDDISSQDLSFHPNGNAIAFDQADKAAVWVFRTTPSPSVMPSDGPSFFPSQLPTKSPVLPPVLPVSSPVFSPVKQPVSQPVSSPHAIVNGFPHPSLTNAEENRGLAWKLSVGFGVPFIVVTVILLIFRFKSNERKEQSPSNLEPDQNSIC